MRTSEQWRNSASSSSLPSLGDLFVPSKSSPPIPETARCLSTGGQSPKQDRKIRSANPPQRGPQNLGQRGGGTVSRWQPRVVNEIYGGTTSLLFLNPRALKMGGFQLPEFPSWERETGPKSPTWFSRLGWESWLEALRGMKPTRRYFKSSF